MTEALTRPELTAADRCDRCGAAAAVRAVAGRLPAAAPSDAGRRLTMGAAVLSPERLGTAADIATKHPTEIQRVLEADLGGDLFAGQVGQDGKAALCEAHGLAPQPATAGAGTKSDVRACDERTVPAGQVVTFDRVEVPGGPADARLWASTQSRSDDAQVEISVVNRIPTEKAGTITTMPLTLAELTTMTSSTRWDALATRYLTLWHTG